MIVPVLYIVSFLDAFAFVLTITAINPYIHHLGGTQFYAGILGSIGAFINLIWNPIVGSMSDTVGRKTVLLQCLFICLLGNLLTAMSSSLTIFFIARIIATFGTQIGTLVKSLVDDNIQNKELKMAAINKIQASSGLCFIFGSLAAGILSEYQNGFQLIWYLVCGFFVVNIVLVSVVAKNQKLTQGSKPVATEVTKAFTNLTKIDWPKYWDLFTIKLITDFVFTVFHFNFSYILMNRFGMTGKNFGYIFSSVSIMGILTSLIMPKMKKILYERDDSGLKRLLHGCLLLILTFLGLGLSPNFACFYICLLPFPAGRVLFETTFTEVILARSGPEQKGGVMGALESTLSLAGLTAPLISGFVSDSWGAETALLLCTIPLTLGTLLAYSQKTKTPKKTQ